jgi:hypothetical protein
MVDDWRHSEGITMHVKRVRFFGVAITHSTSSPYATPFKKSFRAHFSPEFGKQVVVEFG